MLLSCSMLAYAEAGSQMSWEMSRTTLRCVSVGVGFDDAGDRTDDVVEPPVAFVVADVGHRADELARAVWGGADVSVAGEQDRGAVVRLEYASEIRG